MKKTLHLLLFLFFIKNTCISQVTYVNQNATGLNNGSSWQNAYTDLSFAIHNTESGQIWVTAGTYKPTSDLTGGIPTDERLKTFKLKINIGLYGGFAGNEKTLSERDYNKNQTILSGDIGDLNIYTDNVRHVISSEYSPLDKNTILDGITIRDGYSYNQYDGAGIYVNQTSGGSFVVRNCIIENNYSFGYGGGLYVFNSDPVIEHNIFRNNQSYQGGAMYLDYSSAIISNNEIIDNLADNYESGGFSSLSGGGIYVSAYSSPVITNNIIKNNFSRHEGGGVTINSNYHTVFKNNIVIENTSGDGGGIFLDFSKTYFFNNIFAKNTATKSGGAIYMDYVPNQLQFINNTVVFNTAKSEGGGLYLYGTNTDITNSIFYGNNSPGGSQIRSDSFAGNWSPDIKYSVIQTGLNGVKTSGNSIVYENNIDVDPMFIDSDNNNFRLNENSALIDAGTFNPNIISSSWLGDNGEIINFPLTDLDGNQRVVNKMDIGAYEIGTSLGIIENSFANKTILYPNPSNGIFHLNPNQLYDSYSVYSVTGAEIAKNTSKSDFSTVDLTNYPKGLYFITLFIDGKKQSLKLIKE